jgi:hypothetical protein
LHNFFAVSKPYSGFSGIVILNMLRKSGFTPVLFAISIAYGIIPASISDPIAFVGEHLL